MKKKDNGLDHQRTPTSAFSRDWDYRPKEPVAVSPYFVLPPQLGAVLRWIAKSWAPLSVRTIICGLALVTWVYFQPPLETTQTLAFGWIAEMYVRNLLLMTAVAGGLHLYLYVWRKQEDELKFDARDLKRQSRSFTFSNQVRDNMFWTLVSGVTVWTGYEVLLFWSMANGYAPVVTWSENPIWFVLLFWLSPIWMSFHFYWVHRWMHWPPIYKHVHVLHHRNTNVGPWSGMSMHPAEHVIYLSSVLIHFIVPSSPVHVLFHLQYLSLSASTTHAGFEGMKLRGGAMVPLGNFHHQIHHRYFDCNYGNLEMPWDSWFGSYHDGSEAAHEKFLERRKRLRAAKKASAPA